MQYTYSPITLDDLGATLHYHDLVEGTLEVGDVHVTTQYLNHPALTLGYRLEVDGVTVVYSTDHEPHSRRCAAGNREPLVGQDFRHAQFLADADLVIHDTQYTAAEYPSKTGWGHSTVEYVVDVAACAGVRRLALFHHDPTRDDDAIDRLVAGARDRAAKAGGDTEVFGAAEGTVRLPRRAVTSWIAGPAERRGESCADSDRQRRWQVDPPGSASPRRDRRRWSTLLTAQQEIRLPRSCNQNGRR
jgi:hypothetical protein